LSRQLRSNISIDTDPQQQEAAPPRMLVVRSFLRYSALMNPLLPIFAVALSAAASASEISVRAAQQGQYELVLTSPTVLSEGEARDQIARTAASVCKSTTPIFGKWRFESKEAIGGATTSSSAPNTFRFVQEISCASGTQVQSAARLPTLRSDDELRKVQSEVRLKSEAYFKLIASKQVDEAFTHLSATLRSGVTEARWKGDKLSFQVAAGEATQVVIAKVTVYDNPAGAPEPGLYVAADYSNTYREVPIHCGYLMWFRPVGGEFRITREETGHVTSEQLKSIPNAQLSETKRKLRCPAL